LTLAVLFLLFMILILRCSFLFILKRSKGVSRQIFVGRGGKRNTKTEKQHQ